MSIVGAPARPGERPFFLLTIDTEGDDIWSRPREVTTRNAAYLPRFQDLCERYGFAPTYLTNYEMAGSDEFVAFARDALARQAAEIGMHMHAWDTPPIEPLGSRDWFDQPYATEYPAEIIDRKVTFMTRLIEDRFQIRPRSHRAGRWGFGAPYAASLIRHGYEVDCSVTPDVDWRGHAGLTGGQGGVDYTGYPRLPYRIDPQDLRKPGSSALVELPMTILHRRRPWHRALARRLLGRKGPHLVWLRPNGRNLRDLLAIAESAGKDGAPYLMFTLHSSEFMPGGSPSFPDGQSIERLYDHMEQLFEAVARHLSGATLTQAARLLFPH